MTGKQILAVVVGIALAATAAVGGYFYLHGDSKKVTPPEPASTENANGTVAQQAPEEMEPTQKIIWSYSGTYLHTSNSYGFEGADKSCQAQDGHLDEALKMGWKIIAISHYDLPNGQITCIGRDVVLEKQ